MASALLPEGEADGLAPLLADMAHQLRTSLNGVVGMAGVLSQTRLDPGQRQMAEVIESSGRNLGSLLGDVLDLARLQAGRVGFEAQPFSLGELAEALERRLAPELEAQGLRLAVDISPSAGQAEAIGDEGVLRQLVGRLLRHAIGAGGRGEIGLAVALGAGGGAVIEVADCGPDLDAADCARLFDAPVDPVFGRSRGGTGLELVLARAQAEAMGGAVEARPRPEGGVCFRVFLPLGVCQARAA